MSPVSKSEKPGIGSKPRPCRLSVDRLDDPLSMGGDDTSTHGGTEKVSEPILEDSDLTRSGKPPRMAGERAGSIDTAVVGDSSGRGTGWQPKGAGRELHIR